MSVTLQGGCSVTHFSECRAVTTGTVTTRDVIGPANGAKAIALRILEFSHGNSPGFRFQDSDHILYQLETGESDVSSCIVFINEWGYEVKPQTGVYVSPGQTMHVANDRSEPVVFISAQCPASTEVLITDHLGVPSNMNPNAPRRTIGLDERPALPTADRWYRVLVDDELGSEQATQFVGSIPPGRAPDHFHHYEEVIFILRGEGRMWADKSNTPISPGSCIYLPKRQVHCVENTGTDELRLLGVFSPAGSPAVRYEE